MQHQWWHEPQAPPAAPAAMWEHMWEQPATPEWEQPQTPEFAPFAPSADALDVLDVPKNIHPLKRQGFFTFFS